MTLPKWLKTWPAILGILIVILAVVVNISPDRVIMGLDNASPYFFPDDIFHHIDSNSIFVFSGVIFGTPLFTALRYLSISPDLVSNIYVLGCLATGTLGMGLLTAKVVRQLHPEKNRSGHAFYFGVLLFISSLLTMWVFGHPNFLFIAAFGTIPLIILLLVQERSSTIRLILVVLTSFIFLLTTQNIVAFSAYIAQIMILTGVIRRLCYPEEAPSASFSRPLIWGSVVVIVWLIALQSILLIGGERTFILSALSSYTHSLNTPLMEDIRTDIVASESGNDLLSSMRFATGWMELHDVGNAPVFEFYDVFKFNLFFMTIGTIPFLLSLMGVYTAISAKRQSRNGTIDLFMLECAGLFLISSLAVPLFQNIPFVSDAFRWASSKFWPLYFIPLTILAVYGLMALISKIQQKKRLKKHAETIAIGITALITVLFVIYGFPVFSGHIFSSTVQVEMPEEYLELRDKVEGNLLCVPPPQNLYFREYDWGYYGSDFLTYIVKADVIDMANLYVHGNDYDTYHTALVECNTQKLWAIDYVLIDNSMTQDEPTNWVHESNIDRCLSDSVTVEENSYFTLYQLNVPHDGQ